MVSHDSLEHLLIVAKIKQVVADVAVTAQSMSLQNLILGMTYYSHSCQARQESTLIDEHVICAVC